MRVRSFKKIISMILVMLLPFIMLSCKKGFTSPTVIYNENNGLIYWESIPNASYYEIKINDKTETITNSFYLVSELENGEYCISVRAVKEGLVKDYSGYSNELSITLDGKNKYIYLGDETLDNVEELVNAISLDVISSIFTITTKPYYIMTTTSGKSNIYGKSIQGTGCVIKYSSSTCYILTNNHVVIEGDSKYTRCEYTVKDYKGNLFNASLEYNNPDYDLAILSFTPIINSNLIDYSVLSLESEDVSVESKVLSISSPHGQTNCITFGKVLGSEKVTSSIDTKESNVTFDVLKHNTPLESGSSGSPLLSYNLKIVGVNFAIKSGESTSISYSIPLLKVDEFLEGWSLWN